MKLTDTQRRILVELCACKPGMGYPNHAFNRRSVDALLSKGFVERRPFEHAFGGWFRSGDYIAVASTAGRAIISDGDGERASGSKEG